jgi:hypothetical protein
MAFIIQLLVLAYLISLVVMYVVARSAIQDRAWRTILLLIGAAMPFLIAFVLLKNLIRQDRRKLQYVSEIAVVEDAIEAERVKIFGVEPLDPSFAERWQNACRIDMQRVVVWSDKKARQLRAIGNHWGVKHAA